jgi:hypothetical protein
MALYPAQDGAKLICESTLPDLLALGMEEENASRRKR